ncbi:MAG: sulfatase-like hydrolase/transferase [Planctomycetales bacterium]|nr:sulfatase-like hydrolase/transferase [Planctomycetales bacterium]
MIRIMRSFYVALILVLMVGSHRVNSAEPFGPPHLLLIMVDDLGKEWVSCYESQSIQTPRIDQLAQQGLKFTNTYSMPQCTPTRATLLTGQYPFRHGWVNHWDVPRWGAGCHFDPNHYTTFAELLQANGYRTCIAGKWQINDFRVQPQVLQEHGFDEYCVWTGFETQNPPSAERYWDPYIHTQDGSRTYAGKFGDDVFCQFIIDFWKRHKDQPTCAYFPMCLTHGPLVHTPDEPNASTKMEKHTAMVRYTDKLVGRLIDALAAQQMLDNTIVIFTTDNGTDRGISGQRLGKNVRGAKAQLNEAGTSQPFIVYGPGTVPAGKTTDALVDFTDILPTFCELAGAKLPADVTIDGHSFAKVLKGEADDGDRQWILSMGGNPAELGADGRVHSVQVFRDRVIRDKRFKLFVDTQRTGSQLFDLESDPWEQTNLIDSQDPVVLNAKRRLMDVVATLPAEDASPLYDPTPPQPWDRQRKAQ